ncbi:MAG: DUF4386 domain-containing protein [Flavobacteriaceae bacterium]
MTSNKKIARIAGLLYLVVVITGIFSLMYVPSKLIVWDNPTITFNNVVESQALFRFGLISYIICYTSFLILTLVLYELIKSVHHIHAISILVLAMASVPMALLNIQNQFNVLSLIGGENYLIVFNSGQLKAQVLLYLNNYDNGRLITLVFFGLLLFSIGYLVYKSGLIPKILGILLMFACFSNLVNFVGNTFLTSYSGFGISSYI